MLLVLELWHRVARLRDPGLHDPPGKKFLLFLRNTQKDGKTRKPRTSLWYFTSLTTHLGPGASIMEAELMEKKLGTFLSFFLYLLKRARQRQQQECVFERHYPPQKRKEKQTYDNLREVRISPARVSKALLRPRDLLRIMRVPLRAVLPTFKKKKNFMVMPLLNTNKARRRCRRYAK